MFYKFHKLPQTGQEADSPKGGMLKVEVPHWAAEVLIFNSLLEPVAEVGKIKRDTASKSGYSMETRLEPGVYRVQTSLEGKAANEWIPVDEGKTTLVSSKAWETLKFTSASPLKYIHNSKKAHTAKAVELSRKITWKFETGGNSRLFLFVRTLNTKLYGDTFCDGLALFNEAGELITDFSEGVEKDKRQGWMGFTADLPSGGYILRRGRSGVFLRHQVFYLCDGWETQIFLKARRFSSLSTWSLNMVRRGMGFEPDSKTAQASEAILDGLRYGTNNLLLLQNERIAESINILLDEKKGNPWLGILAAHAISRLDKKTNEDQSNSPSNRRIKDEDSQANAYIEILEEKVKPFLRENIGAHPDVRALLLDAPGSNEIFHFPPTLLESLQLVRNHSLTEDKVIPLDCLTDCVIDSLVINSPWTAWRRLLSEPKYEDYKTTSSQLFRKMKPPAGKNAPAEISVSAILSQATAPRTPIYHLAERETTEPQQTSLQTALQDAPMIQQAKRVVLDYAKTNKLSDLPKKIIFNSTQLINKALDQINPEDISRIFGISLARIEESLKSLNLQASNLLSDEPAESVEPGKNLFAQQAILGYALTPSDEDLIDFKDNEKIHSRYLIRETVSKIQSEADRLGITIFAGESQKLQISTEMAQSLAEQLYTIAENLLKHVDFILLTDEKGKVLYSNSTFLLLTAPKSFDRVKMSSEELSGYRLAKQREWESILQQAKNGVTNVINPAEAEDWQNWRLSRTKIEDEAANGLVSYLNLFRLKGVLPLKDDILQKIASTVETLVFYVPLIIYGSPENRSEYEESVSKTIEWLESQMKKQR